MARPPSQTYEDKRQSAIEAAARVFARKGYHGASTGDIARDLGIRQGSLYYYFSSKEEALEEVCVMAMSDYVRGMETIAATDAPFHHRLRQMIHFHLSNYRGGSDALKVHNEHRFYLPEERRQRIKQDGQRYREILQRLFEEQVGRGVLAAQTDCLFVAHSVIGLCNAWGTRIVREEIPGDELDELSGKCVRLILRGVGYDHLD